MSIHKNRDIRIPLDKDNQSIVRIEELCDECGQCRIICEDQSAVGRMYDLESAKDIPVCMNCGQCASVCPTDSIRERYEYQDVQKAIDDPGTIVIFQTAPAVRVALGEEFGLEPGTFVEGKMIAALRALNADYVLDTCFAADLTIMEEASELVTRIRKKGTLPQFTSCCPAWVKFAETFYPEFIPNISSAKSPALMLGSTIKTYFAEHKGIEPTKIVNVAVMPCTAKKAEIRREEMQTEDRRDVDFVITTRELAIWLKEKKVDFNALDDSQFDKLMGDASGGAVIFGNTGGVMEAAARTAYNMITGETLRLVKFKSIRGMEGVRSAKVDFGGTKMHLAAVHGLDNARRVMVSLKQGQCDFDFIEVMGCYGGCINGGGQPKTEIPVTDELRSARRQALYDRDSALTLRSSHENPEIQALYKDFYEKPLSDKAHNQLHTSFTDRSHDLGEKGAVYMRTKRRLPLLICDIMMFVCLLILIQTPIRINMIRGIGGGMDEWRLFYNLHIIAGCTLAVLIVCHIIFNIREILSVKKYFKFPPIVKAQYWIMFLVLISMIVSIITGIMWAVGPATNFVRVLHSYSSWIAFVVTGMHIGVHLGKYISLHRI